MEPTKSLNELWQPVVEAIHASNFRAVLAVTGGGSRAIAALVETPGASRTVLEAVVPYSHNSLCQWIGGTPDQACSEATARAMAMAAWVRARTLAPEADPMKLIGIGCTASLATDRPKRGAHRVHVAVQSGAFTRTYYLQLDSSRLRAEEEPLVATMVLAALAKASEVKPGDLTEAIEQALSKTERPTYLEQFASGDKAWTELVLAECREVARRPPKYPPGTDWLPARLVFPGSFNPLHPGHLRMAEIAERRVNAPLIWEISVHNVEKPPLDCLTFEERIAAIEKADPTRCLLLTDRPTFSEKAARFNGATFVVGADTISRIANPKYYSSESARDTGCAKFKAAGCRFLVFGRCIDGQFQTLSDLTIPPALLELCDEVTAEEFREDISSTELRN